MTLEHEFERKVLEIKTDNYFAIIKKLKQFIIDDEFFKTGKELSDEEANLKAHEKFCEAKRKGIYDGLNLKKEMC